MNFKEFLNEGLSSEIKKAEKLLDDNKIVYQYVKEVSKTSYEIAISNEKETAKVSKILKDAGIKFELDDVFFEVGV